MNFRRSLALFALVLTFLLVVTAVSQAQDNPPLPSGSDLLIVKQPPKEMIDGIAPLQNHIEKTDFPAAPMTLLGGEPADSCSEATPLIVSPLNPADGGAADVSNATVEPDDPVLACMWGNPPHPQGFRTVWYTLFAPVSGRLTLDTFNSSYDTVLGVYTGECGALEALHCNDDNNFFSSQVTVALSEGETYYIEIADRNPGLPQPANMQLSALLEPVDSKWTQILTNPAPPPVSRHAVVSQGEYLYIIGGQSGESGLPQVSSRLLRFNTNTLSWFELAAIPGAGYSNTTAALANGKIYLPSGYDGNSVSYDGLHWAYDIAANSWSTVAGIPPWELPHGVPFAWASAAVPPAQNRYYLTGGLSSANADIPPINVENKVSSQTYVYLTNPNSWLKLAPMQAGRYAHTSTWIEQNNLGICVAGGLGVQSDPESGQLMTILHRSAECYQPGGSWRYIGDMNIPRYGAGSAIGPDGRWYIFGGMTTAGDFLVPVRRTEVYDPVRNTWTVLDPSYNLGTFLTMPARFWPRGAVVGNNLWAVGGSSFADGEEPLPIIERLPIPSNSSFFPVLSGNYDDGTRPDDTFSQAREISFSIPQSRNFDQQRDFFDVYTFEIFSSRSINIHLDVPNNNNFDVAVFGRNKTQWGESVNPRQGQDEELTINNLPPNRYYIVVSRVYPTRQPDLNAYYTIVVN
jgi:N-acetylneuraminic acid mutarotase